MSSRPRPVTATFKPPSMAPAVGIRTYSVSSESSMESLLSILDHDSYESLSDSSDDEVASSRCRVTIDDSTLSASKVQKRTTAKKSEFGADECKSTPRKGWKEWMVEKAIEQRSKRRNEEVRQKRQAEEQVRKEKEKDEKLVIVERKIKEWMDAKKLAEMSRQVLKISEGNDKKLRQREEGAYQRWVEHKQEADIQRKSKEREQKQEHERERENKERRSAKAYEEWLKKARSRPKSAPTSLGYSCGKLTGYYDTCTYPTPSFINPLPWKPVEIPKQRPIRKRPNSAPKKRYY